MFHANPTRRKCVVGYNLYLLHFASGKIFKIKYSSSPYNVDILFLIYYCIKCMLGIYLLYLSVYIYLSIYMCMFLPANIISLGHSFCSYIVKM